MNSKALIALISGILLIAVVVGAFFLFSKKNGSSPIGQNIPAAPSDGGIPVSQAIPNTPTGPFINIGTPKGTVQVKNFYLANPEVVEGGTVIIKQTQGYVLAYITSSGAFSIQISGTPFANARNAAEQDFLATLAITNQTDACKLSVSEGVPYDPGSSLSGQSFPLSFCGGGFASPQ